MSKVVWSYKKVLPDEGNEMDAALIVQKIGNKLEAIAEDSTTPSFIDGTNKIYIVSVTIEELDNA